MECPDCHLPWSSTEVVPRILSCGHTLCEACALRRFDSTRVLCQECRVFHVFALDRDFSETDKDYSSRCIGSLSKNFTLLSIASANRNSNDVADFELEICEEHNLPLHSFSVKPESELCDECLQDVQDLGLDIRPIPKVCEYFDGLIKKLAKIMNGHLEKIDQFLDKRRNNENFEKFKAEETISNFFDGFFTAGDSVLEDVERQLKGKIRDIEENNRKVREQVGIRKEILGNLISQVKYLDSLSDEDLVQKAEICENLLSTTRPLEELLTVKSLSFSSNKAKLMKLKSIIENSYKISLKKYLNTWICSKCSSVNQDGQISCQSCKLFRPIETYPHLSRHPSLASEQELHELNLRRQSEIQRISQLDKIDPGGIYFLIHAGWVNKWKEFVLNKGQEKHVNKEGSTCFLPPGPVCNHLLFEDEACLVIKKKLRAAVDYRGLNQQVWDAYIEIYGGGPQIKRRKVSIYEGSGQSGQGN
jgi:hypothetical protein